MDLGVHVVSFDFPGGPASIAPTLARFARSGSPGGPAPAAPPRARGGGSGGGACVPTLSLVAPGLELGLVGGGEGPRMGRSPSLRFPPAPSPSVSWVEHTR